MSSPDVGGPARSRGQADNGDPVLLSKLTRPDVPGWAVARTRVEKLIAEGVRGPLTLVTGPPGAGKTMAIASWATGISYPCALAWITLNEYDNRPRVFWSYVVAALKQAGVCVPRVLLGPSGQDVDHDFLVRLASALAAQDPPVVMVLDDLHLLAEQASVPIRGRCPMPRRRSPRRGFPQEMTRRQRVPWPSGPSARRGIPRGMAC
jgi:LuxR family transcriptional regulator, maltose regulon positive regulatory protein